MSAVCLHREGDGTPADPPGAVRVGAFRVAGPVEPGASRIDLWELGGWEHTARILRDDVAAGPAGADRRRLLVPAHYSPPPAADPGDECCYQELVALVPGAARRFLDLVAEHRLPLADSFGWRLLGAYRTAMVHDSEALLLWGVPTWERWARWESAEASDPGVAIWRGHLEGVVRDWRNRLLVPLSATSP